MYIEERVDDLENEVDRLKKNNHQLLTNHGYITTEDVLKAVCKHLKIDIVDIDNTPTVKKL